MSVEIRVYDWWVIFIMPILIGEYEVSQRSYDKLLMNGINQVSEGVISKGSRVAITNLTVLFFFKIAYLTYTCYSDFFSLRQKQISNLAVCPSGHSS